MMPVSVFPDEGASSSAADDAPRKSRRLSPGLGLSVNARPNADAASRNTTRLPKFGFNPTKAAKKSTEPVAPVPTPPPLPPVDVLLDALGDLDAHNELVEPRPAPNTRGWDLNKYRTKEYPELLETAKQLKAALRSQIERAKRASGEVGPLQEEINRRFTSLAEEVSTQRAAADLANTELVTERQKAENRAKTIVDLKVSIEALNTEIGELKQKATAEGERADTAEASLRERSEDLRAALSAGEELQEAKDAAGAAAEEAAAVASAEIERLVAAGAETTATLEAARAEAAATEAALTASRDAEVARVAELEKQLSAALAESAHLKEAKAALDKEHAALSETSAATRATLESTQKQLEEKSATLIQKDDDLRESLRNNTQMQKDNAAVVQHERERSQALEDEARKLRTSQQEATAAATAAEQAKLKATEELEATAAELSSTQAALQHANSERERLAIETSERADKLAAQQQAVAALELKGVEAAKQLEAKESALAAKTEEAEGLARDKQTVEVEFSAYQEHHSSSNQEQMAAISELKVSVDRLKGEVQSKQVEVQSTQGTVAMQEAYLATLESKLRDQERMRRELHNTIQELKGNIRVFCRVRPAAEGAQKAIDIGSDGQKVTVQHASGSAGSTGAKMKAHEFSFDKVFAPSIGQEGVFTEVDGLVQSALDGYKVCIFAYGQTGSGKTFTMQGGEAQSTWGIIPRALAKILALSEAMKADGWAWTLSASFLEIYNEQLRDLLHDPKAGPPASYAIRDDEAWGTVVANMGRTEVSSMDQINRLMAKAAKARAVGSTKMNAQSSRSHSVFALYLQGTNDKLGTQLHGALHLVDLAGSERLSQSGAVGEAAKETAAINKSLSALGKVFMAKKQGDAHVPFRDSTLTKLMKPCLSGHGKTLMVVNVGPEADNSHETKCSLEFAEKVNQCDTSGGQGGTKPVRSVGGVPAARKPAEAQEGVGLGDAIEQSQLHQAMIATASAPASARGEASRKQPASAAPAGAPPAQRRK